MKVCGIICEFDPFHGGHKHLLDSVRSELGADAVVCVMSGDFTQRGAPASEDKYHRAAAAVRGGADLVLELPAAYAVNGASVFARGGIGILSGLGFVDAIAFGSESGDAEGLKRAASLLASESGAFSARVKELSASGLSYQQSYSAAAAELGIDFFSGASPNDMLACEYLKEAASIGFSPEVFCVKRRGTGHADEGEPDFLSGSSIRKAIASSGGLADALETVRRLRDALPDASLPLLGSLRAWEGDGEDAKRLFSVIQYLLVSRGASALASAPSCSEGLENRIMKAARNVVSFDGLAEAASGPRYSRSRVRRCLIQALLGIERGLTENPSMLYARPLAFGERGAELLRTASESSKIPVFTNLNKNVPEDSPCRPLLQADVRAADVYSALTERKLYDGSDLTCNPFFLRV